MNSTAIPPRVSLYGNWTRGGMRSMTPAEAVAFVAQQGEDRLTCILGAMRPGYLGREVLTLAQLREAVSA